MPHTVPIEPPPVFARIEKLLVHSVACFLRRTETGIARSEIDFGINDVYAALKGFHLVFMVTWFAGLFYLPRLFVYHAMTADKIGLARFKTMERKLYVGIMLPAAVFTICSGAGLAFLQGINWIQNVRWFHWKLGLVMVLLAYHLYLGRILRRFESDCNQHTHVFYRWLNEFPVLILVAIVLIAVIKPS